VLLWNDVPTLSEERLRRDMPLEMVCDMGVAEMDVVGARGKRADSGVGAPIVDFLGVSESNFPRLVEVPD
jgi:hypothetical protein